MKSVERDEKIANVQHEMPESPPNESDLVGNQRRIWTFSMRSELILWTNQHIENEATINFMYYRMYRSDGRMAFRVNTLRVEINNRLMANGSREFLFEWSSISTKIDLTLNHLCSCSHFSAYFIIDLLRIYTINAFSFDTKYILPFRIILTTVTIQYDCKSFSSWSQSENSFP